jgi:hypothetical protein
MPRCSRQWIRRSVSGLAVTAVLAAALPAFAQRAFGVDPVAAQPPAATGTEQAVVARYWELGRPRAFFSSTFELGYAYLKPRFALGYGLPYWRWIGLEAYPLVSLNGLGHYAGIGGAIPGLQFRAGGRYTFPFSRFLLTPRSSFTRMDLEVRDGPRADYLSLEAELSGTLPAPAGSLFAVLTGYRTALVPDGYYLYEENLRQVMKPPYIWRARLGYLFAFGRDAAIRLGPTGDLIGLPGREEYVVRAGLVASVAIDAHLEAQASLVPVIVSPDSLGLAGADFGQLGIRLRWATGSTPDPEAVRREREEALKRVEP